jgi:hypothetical protein
LTVRDSIFAEIRRLVPGEFGEDYYDTNPGGKGYKNGYISFALDPISWDTEGIIGGILFQCSYDPNSFKSESSGEDDVEWKGHTEGGGIIQIQMSGCYYNKQLGGGCASREESGMSKPVSLGKIDVLIDVKEKVEDIKVDESALASGVKSLIKEISSNPPDYAQSEKRKQKSKVPTGSPASLLKHLIQTGRSDVGKSELEGLARAMSARQERPVQNVLQEVTKFFQDRGWAINPRS